jgi:signal transduction histidine kinase
VAVVIERAEIESFRALVARRLGLAFEDGKLDFLADILRRRVEAMDGARLLADLENKNRELEAFSYSISHDLRAPLRSIDGFSKILLKEQANNLDDEGKRLLGIVVTSTRRMGQLIDDLLQFSRLGRTEMRNSPVDMTILAQSVLREMLASCKERMVETTLGPLPGTRGGSTPPELSTSCGTTEWDSTWTMQTSCLACSGGCIPTRSSKAPG